MVNDQFIAKLEWDGEVIQIGKDGRFYVPLTEAGYATIDAAHEAIDKRKKQIAAIGKKKLTLAVIDESLAPRVITGIHAGNASKLVNPRPDRSVVLYPDHANIRRLLGTKAALESEIEKIDKRLRGVRMANDPYVGSSGFDIANRYTALENEYANKMLAVELLGEDEQ